MDGALVGDRPPPPPLPPSLPPPIAGSCWRGG